MSSIAPGIAALLLTLCMAGAPVLAQPADLEVEIRGVKPHAGDVHAALFDREAFAVDTEIRAMISAAGEISAGVFTGDDQFPRPPIDRITVSSSARMLRLTFRGVEPGEYAVGAYQDVNGNGRLDATVTRNPTEPRGLSNNPRPKERGPSWDESKFTVLPGGANIVIELR